MTAATPLSSATLRSPSQDDVDAGSHAAHLLDLLRSCTDLSTASDEIELACTTWHERYHLSTVRANILRALPPHGDAIVLEVGARAGAVTRHLGETSAMVDAIEPDPALAAVVAHRCSDLPSVDVRVGWIDDVPTEPRYDLIVAVDVLGEVQRRGADLASFIQQCRSLLTPGGRLVLAVDNTDGVRFLAGDATPTLAPSGDDRLPRASRDEIERAVRGAGMTSVVLGAFPDHRTARTLLDVERLEALAPSMLRVLPSFPSPTYDGPRANDTAEGRLWSAAVDAGTAGESVNGFVAIASAAEPALPAAATFWSLGRRASLSATNRVLPGDGSGPVVERSLTFPDAPPVDGPLRLRPHTEPLMRGTPLTQALADCTDLDAARDLIRGWSSLVERSTSDQQPVPWDLIPRNVLIREDGELAAFDQEWELEPTPAAGDLVRRRGAFWLAYDLVTSRRPVWLCGTTIGESADFLLRLAQPDAPADWLRTFFDQESIHMSHVWPTTPRHPQPARARRERNSVSSLSNMIPPEDSGSVESADTPQTLREVVESLSAANADLRAENEALRFEQRRMALTHRDHTVGLVAQLEALRDRLARAQRESRRHKERALRLQEQLTSVKASTSWRVGSQVVRPFAPLGRKRRR
ncbi:methyltransferase domain-containing protein [Aeromicrobium wangtongii]|uniref:Class I SAM-dependent methyltransferase n=1 Tax=Aeromicrobium wangtongii TaxID=2969247 RepID=A0ABY5MAX9_9ACTN|nr:methyltransferase domain-containing protein [Aeromicrobium wangtongii]MCD9196761.1 class I SAM-dependent methyltransferase [Aeromicrobium wangtongii]UUP14271.1 class I SAM-dependent methyltransferase [Aeromicrobium wangtongii]